MAGLEVELFEFMALVLSWFVVRGARVFGLRRGKARLGKERFPIPIG